MQALRFHQFGSPSVLQLQTVPDPVPSSDEVLVKIHAASINPSDVKNVQGNMEGTALPRTPGRDFAGVIVKGSETLLGTEVWGTGGDVGFTRDGSHAEYILLPQAAVCPKPKALSMAEAGSAGVTYVTAWLAVIDAAQLTAGETLLVVGATGGVGSAAIQIGKWKGAHVLGTIRHENDRDLASQTHLDTVINLEHEPLHDAVLDATEGRGADVILDTVGGSMVETCLGALNRKGRLIEISAPPKESRISFDLRDFYHRESQLLGVDSRASDVTACAKILAALTPGFETGQLRLLTAAMQTYALNDAVQAYEQILNRTVKGRAVLIPN
ncbi:MAG: zinc-binding alcohol dehydrogenase family protein [Leptolyngbya sp. BL-A-14]